MNNQRPHDHRTNRAGEQTACCITPEELQVLQLVSDPESEQVTFLLQGGRVVRAIKERHLRFPSGTGSERAAIEAMKNLKHGSLTISRADGRTLTIAEQGSVRLGSAARR